MIKWPFTSHDDVPDAISDLDKKDESNPRHPLFYLPGPPAGWAAAPIQAVRQPVVDGQFNPEYGYPAREFTRHNQGGHDLWRRPNSTPQPNPQTQPQGDPSASFFLQPPPPPTPLE